MRHWLFVCSENRLRSPTAEAVFSEHEGVEALGAGIGPLAARPVTADLLHWADTVFVMEPLHRDFLHRHFGPGLEDKPVVVLDIPDRFPYMDPELVDLLETEVMRYLDE